MLNNRTRTGSIIKRFICRETYEAQQQWMRSYLLWWSFNQAYHLSRLVKDLALCCHPHKDQGNALQQDGVFWVFFIYFCYLCVWISVLLYPEALRGIITHYKIRMTHLLLKHWQFLLIFMEPNCIVRIWLYSLVETKVKWIRWSQVRDPLLQAVVLHQ